MIEEQAVPAYHIVIRTVDGIPPELIEQLIGKSLIQDGIITLYQQEPVSKDRSYRDWFHAVQLVSVELSKLFIRDFIINNEPVGPKLFETLRTALQPFDNPMSTTYSHFAESLNDITFVRYSIYVKTIDDHLLRFIFPWGNKTEVDALAWKTMLHLIANIYNDPEEIKQINAGLRLRPDKTIFLFYDNAAESWRPLNAAIERAKELSDRYRHDKDDPRVSKPGIIVNEDNYSLAKTHDHQWMLQKEKDPIIMAKPNDVALYISLMRKNIEKACKFYNENVHVLTNTYYNAILNNKKTSAFYDYFEDVISAVIFSYTSIEALANSCIPWSYKHQEEKSGVTTIWSKESIERKFSLRDKLKTILKDILKTPDPTKESWWNTFILLEETRDEIIHTKQSKSEDRYGKLLAKGIFDVIGISEAVIRFYGTYIEENAKESLDIFPFDFGHDYVLPGFMTGENYIKMEKRSRGIPD